MGEMDGGVVNPGDLHGRVLPADEVNLCWGGNLMCALVGPDLVVGVSGFGAAAHDALRELADNLVREAVWIEITDDAELGFEPAELTGGSIQTNVVGFYRKGTQICAYVGPEKSGASVWGFGDSVHEALRQLANRLVAQGVWIEVTDIREWRLEPLDPTQGVLTDLPHSAWGSPSCLGYLSAITRGNEAQIICSECGGIAYVGPSARLDETINRMKCTRMTTIPHESFGAPECCGCLNAVTRGDQADIICGECDATIRTVPVADLERVITEMELSLNISNHQCPHCRSVNIVTGFSSVMAYTCRNCSEVVRLSDDSDVDRFFGSDPE
jgi:hypothetical protein